MINHAFERITPLKLAFGEKCGRVLMDQQSVLMLSLDELIRRLNLPRVDIIKIDVEGAD